LPDRSIERPGYEARSLHAPQGLEGEPGRTDFHGQSQRNTSSMGQHQTTQTEQLGFSVPFAESQPEHRGAPRAKSFSGAGLRLTGATTPVESPCSEGWNRLTGVKLPGEPPFSEGPFKSTATTSPIEPVAEIMTSSHAASQLETKTSLRSEKGTADFVQQEVISSTQDAESDIQAETGTTRAQVRRSVAMISHRRSRHCDALGDPLGDLGGSCDVGGSGESQDIIGLSELWEQHHKLQAEAERLRTQRAESEQEVLRLRGEVAQLKAELASSEEKIKRFRSWWVSQRMASKTPPSVSQDDPWEDDPRHGCHRFSNEGADHSKESRARVKQRKDKLRAWAEEAQTKLEVGAVIRVLRTVRYKWSTDTSKHYELTCGLQGTVLRMDADGDAEVDWKDFGKKWLLSKDFYKVTIETPPPTRASPRRPGQQSRSRSLSRDPPPTSIETYFQVGEEYDTRSAVILRAAEDIQSEWRGELVEGARVTLLEVGAVQDRRVRVRCRTTGTEGWMSKLTQSGTLLIGRVKAVNCPKGHTLQLITEVKRGKCDQCNKDIARGEQVMDCHECNWYLCGTCHPQDKVRVTSVRQELLARRERRSMRKSISSVSQNLGSPS